MELAPKVCKLYYTSFVLSFVFATIFGMFSLIFHSIQTHICKNKIKILMLHCKISCWWKTIQHMFLELTNMHLIPQHSHFHLMLPLNVSFDSIRSCVSRVHEFQLSEQTSLSEVGWCDIGLIWFWSSWRLPWYFSLHVLWLGKTPEQEFIFRSSNQIYFDTMTISSGSEHVHNHWSSVYACCFCWYEIGSVSSMKKLYFY